MARFTRGGAAIRASRRWAIDYETVGEFYAALGETCARSSSAHGEAAAFCRRSGAAARRRPRSTLTGTEPVICLKTALAAFDAIVEQGEGAPGHSETSHFQQFLGDPRGARGAAAPRTPRSSRRFRRRRIRCCGRRRPKVASGSRTRRPRHRRPRQHRLRLMLRLLAYSYVVPRAARDGEEPRVDLALGLMRAVTLLAERAARLPARPVEPDATPACRSRRCAMRAPLPPGAAARSFFIERLGELADAPQRRSSRRRARRTRAAAILERSRRSRASDGFAAVALTPAEPSTRRDRRTRCAAAPRARRRSPTASSTSRART